MRTDIPASVEGEAIVTKPDFDEDLFLQTARRRFSDASDAERTIREEASTDLAFRTGDQWKPLAREIREAENRPCLTINRIPQFIHSVANELRKQPPAMQVLANGEGSSADAADIWQGLMRHIEVRSDADAAYFCAFDNSVGNSFGWWRILTEYAGDDTFDQEIVIKQVADPFSVYIDPGAKEPDRSDMKWAFVKTTLTREEFRLKYPKSKMVTMGFFDTFDQSPGPDWLDADNVQVAEYWVVETRKRTLQMISAPQQLSDQLMAIFGESKFANLSQDGLITLTVYSDEYKGVTLPEGCQIEQERDVDYPTVKWYTITGTDILDRAEWAGKYIPLVPVFGEEIIVNGRKQLISLTRFIRDSQALYNYFRSQQAEVIALTPKAPYIGPVGSFKSHQAMWKNANNRNYPYMEYDLVNAADGRPAPPPQRSAVEPPIQAINQAVLQANDDLKAGTGIYDPSLGARSNETSGRAILARQQESDSSNFHFIENFRRAMRHQGRILMDLIPHIYDRKERIVRIVKPDTTHEMVMINGATSYKGKPAMFEPGVGRYDVTVDIDVSYKTKEQQTFEMLSKYAETNPNLWAIMGDLIMRATPGMPSAIKNEAADRMKVLLPPQIQQMANGQTPPDPQMQAQLQQAMQVAQMAMAQVQKLQMIIQTKQLELESKEKIAVMQAQTQIIVAELSAHMQSAQKMADYDFAQLEHRLGVIDMAVQAELDKQVAAAAPKPAAPAKQ